jgi:hypothetical protein
VIRFLHISEVACHYSLAVHRSPRLRRTNPCRVLYIQYIFGVLDAARTYPYFERVLVFIAFAAIFASSRAIILEYLQGLTPDRRGILIDASEKVIGGALGISAAPAIIHFRHRERSPRIGSLALTEAFALRNSSIFFETNHPVIPVMRFALGLPRISGLALAFHSTGLAPGSRSSSIEQFLSTRFTCHSYRRLIEGNLRGKTQSGDNQFLYEPIGGSARHTSDSQI